MAFYLGSSHGLHHPCHDFIKFKLNINMTRHAGNDIADALATKGRAGHAMPSAALILKARSAFSE